MKKLSVLLLLVLVGCAELYDVLPPVEACYNHPKYGQVCFVINGKKHYAEALTPQQRAEVERWILDSERKE